MEFIGQKISQQVYRNIQDGIVNGSNIIYGSHMFDAEETVSGWTPQVNLKVVHSDYLGRAVTARLALACTSAIQRSQYSTLDQ